MKTTRPTITNLGLSPDEERHHRMIKYSVAMGIRLVCLFVAIVVPGWWAAVPIVAAIFLPYIAVVIANVSVDPRRGEAQRPGNILPMTPPPSAAGDRTPHDRKQDQQ